MLPKHMLRLRNTTVNYEYTLGARKPVWEKETDDTALMTQGNNKIMDIALLNKHISCGDITLNPDSSPLYMTIL